MIDIYGKYKEAEKENENNLDSDENNRYNKYKKGGKQWQDKYKTKGRKTFENRQKFNKKNQRERSRSYSREKNDYENYDNYSMQQKGFYPPKGRFGPPMMPMGGISFLSSSKVSTSVYKVRKNPIFLFLIFPKILNYI